MSAETAAAATTAEDRGTKRKTMSPVPIIHYYRKTEAPHSLLPSCREQLSAVGLQDDVAKIVNIETESCFNVQLSTEPTTVQKDRLQWLLAETFEKDYLSLEKSFFSAEDSTTDGEGTWLVEFGPRMTFTSAFSSNATSICLACDIPVERLELSRRYRFILSSADGLSDAALKALKGMLHDRMTTRMTTAITNGESIESMPEEWKGVDREVAQTYESDA